MRNKNDSDHNTITACVDIISGTKKKGAIKTDWNLKAPEEKWEQFRKELRNSVEKAKEIMKNKEVEMSERYSTPRAKTDKLEEPVNRELNVTRS